MIPRKLKDVKNLLQDGQIIRFLKDPTENPINNFSGRYFRITKDDERWQLQGDPVAGNGSYWFGSPKDEEQIVLQIIANPDGTPFNR